MFNHLKSFALLLTVCLAFMAQSAIADKIRVTLGGSSTSRTDGIYLDWSVKRQVVPDDGGLRYWTPVIGCDCQIYRDGALIATVQSGEGFTHYHDLDVVAGQKYSYVVNAMGENSNTREVTCERNNSKDIYPEVSDDSGVAAALEGSADAKLVANITDAAEYAAYRVWVLGLDGVTAQQVKDSAYAWLSYALDTDALIAAAPKEGDLTIGGFTQGSSAGFFDLSVSISGITVGDNATAANLKKVFGVEGAGSLDESEFKEANVDIEFGKPEGGKVKIKATPKDPTAKQFFMRVRMKQ